MEHLQSPPSFSQHYICCSLATEVESVGHQHYHHLGTCYIYGTSGLTQGLMNQYIFSQDSQGIHTIKSEKHVIPSFIRYHNAPAMDNG